MTSSIDLCEKNMKAVYKRAPIVKRVVVAEPENAQITTTSTQTPPTITKIDDPLSSISKRKNRGYRVEEREETLAESLHTHGDTDVTAISEDYQHSAINFLQAVDSSIKRQREMDDTFNSESDTENKSKRVRFSKKVAVASSSSRVNTNNNNDGEISSNQPSTVFSATHISQDNTDSSQSPPSDGLLTDPFHFVNSRSMVKKTVNPIVAKKSKNKIDIIPFDLKDGDHAPTQKVDYLRTIGALNRETEESYAKRQELIAEDANQRMQKDIEKASEKGQLAPEHQDLMIQNRNVIAQEKNLPIAEQQTYYPVVTTELDRYKALYNAVTDKTVVRKEAGGAGAALSEFVSAYDVSSTLDIDQSFVLRIIREQKPSTFQIQSEEDRYQINILPRPWEYEQANLWEPSEGELPCVFNDKCKALKMGTVPIILKQCLPSDKVGMELSPSERYPCVVCSRYNSEKFHYGVRVTSKNIKGKMCLQSHYNLTNQPGEYDLRQCFMSSRKKYQGTPKPVVHHVPDWYKQVRHPITGKLGFLQTGYTRFDPQDEYWKNMDEKIKKRQGFQ